MVAIIDYQQAFDADQGLLATLPGEAQVTAWASAVLSHLHIGDKEITVRFVNNEESQQLNNDYRGKDKPTNVLSFPFECPPEVPLDLLGDLVICVPVIAREAEEQQKPIADHYAHMIVHGTLHLLGYDHIEDAEAEEMEGLEIAILAKLAIDDPYQDD
ncbi:MAG: rRNA maturation RNase YbeY [Aestuariibacter sp.]|nr:rRNA maturation RNase YbeY [Aestuariibacter sp.]